jgi:hypothetical protein
MVKVSVERRMNSLSAFTRALDVDGVTDPPCGHDIELVTVRKSEGIR